MSKKSALDSNEEREMISIDEERFIKLSLMEQSHLRSNENLPMLGDTLNAGEFISSNHLDGYFAKREPEGGGQTF
jgi:hypothetical protein